MATTRTHHKKISRKELKQPDEFFTFIGEARDFLLDNLRQVIISAAIVLAAALLAIGVYIYERHLDNLAGDQFYAAMSALNQKNYKQAEAGFEKLAQSEPGREVGKLSRFYLGSAYFESGDLNKARDTLVAYLAESRDPVFTNLALTDLAVVYERLGEFKKAEGAYSQAASVPGPEQTRAQLGVARMILKQGDLATAIKAYQTFLQEHPFSQDRQTVVETLAQLGAGPSGGPPAAQLAPVRTH
jgi:tetratricopeptide (TPR) repeat protein